MSTRDRGWRPMQWLATGGCKCRQTLPSVCIRPLPPFCSVIASDLAKPANWWHARELSRATESWPWFRGRTRRPAVVRHSLSFSRLSPAITLSASSNRAVHCSSICSSLSPAYNSPRSHRSVRTDDSRRVSTSEYGENCSLFSLSVYVRFHFTVFIWFLYESDKTCLRNTVTGHIFVIFIYFIRYFWRRPHFFSFRLSFCLSFF